MPADVVQSDKTVLVTIDKLVHGGNGLAPEGAMALFGESVRPGESGRVRLERVKKGYAEGRLVEVVTPSPDRSTAQSPVYGRCGGCQRQHASAGAQLELKRAMLTETLVRLGGLTDVDVPPLVASPEVYGYRNRARLAVVTPKGKTASLAYHEEGSHRLVPIAACPLLAPRLNEAIAHLNRTLAGSGVLATVLQEVRLALSVTTGELMIQYEAERCTRRQAEGWFERVRTGLAGLKGQVLIAGRGLQQRRWMDGETALTEQVAGLRLRCSDRSFVQANWRLNETLVETVIDWTLTGQDRAPLRVLELYAGIGNFGLPLARGGALVTLVEANPAALADARNNARVNHVGRCRFRQGPAEAILDTSMPDEYDLVLMDPPRTGLSKEALAGLLRLRPHRLVYLSCDPPTLARDLRAMREAGYCMMRVQGFDMFPQTMHIETLVELTQAA